MDDSQLDRVAEALSRNPGASLARVAEVAGIGRATLYRHFETRDGLIRAIALRSLAAIDQEVAGLENRVSSAREYLERMFEALVPLGPRYRFLMMEGGITQDPDVALEIARQREGMKELVEELKREGTCASDLPTAWVAESLDAILFAAWESVSNGDLARNEAAKLATRTALQGLGPVEPRASV